MTVLDFSTSHSQVISPDEIINVPNSNPVKLKHDIFYNKIAKAILISTGPGGTGTVLVNPLDGASDYTPGDAYTFSIASQVAAMGADTGYTTIAITNATYHNTDLYVSYYPIWDLFYASRFNNNEIWESQGDYDISASNTTFDLTEVNSYPIGYKFRISWYDGDGSNTLSFTDNGETIDGVSVADWIGDGTGHLDLIKLDDLEFETRNSGEIWDSDGGNFTGTFEKKLNGIQESGLEQDMSAGTYTWAIAFVSATYGITHAILENAAGASYVINFTNRTTTQFDIVIRNAETSSNISKITYVRGFGRWTASYPKKS